MSGPTASNRYGGKDDSVLTPAQRRRVRKRGNVAKRKRKRQAAAKKRAGSQ